MVRIRLRRVGAKKQPSYRVVVADSRAARDGRFIEIIGFYNPRTEPETVSIKRERALYWLSVGAQPSEPVLRLLTKVGVMDYFKRLKAGEPLEALLAEMEAEAAAEEAAKAAAAVVEEEVVAEAASEVTAEATVEEAVEVEPAPGEGEPVGEAAPEVTAEGAVEEAGEAEPAAEEEEPAGEAAPEATADR
ncbi:MAG TPA: 30S ribosomal protein S16 [Chloroflexi bacterium]|nr:30S ribosomal protein S16 [Chloroflexota bacterium]